jgi:hypothetical protein
MTAMLQQQQNQPRHQQCVKQLINATHSSKHSKHVHNRPQVSLHSHRREALTALGSLPIWAVTGAPAPAAAVAAAQERDPTFYASWPYATPADILPYIQQQAAPGDAQAVLDAMDTFSLYYP